MSSIFEIGAISAGDIVFVYDRSPRVRNKISRFINVIGQRILASIRKEERLRLAPRVRRYSHVMLGVGGGLIIHADGKSVAVEVISDALHHHTREASLFQIYRRKDISRDLAEKIVKSAMRYYGQRYRFSTYFAEPDAGDTTQFCSRLVAHAYRSAGVPLSSLTDSKVLPVDLYQICQSRAWNDVSAEFVQQPPPPAINELLPTIEIPGQGELSLSDFLTHSDAVILEAARLTKENIKLQYDTTRTLLHNEALLARFSSFQFDLSKQIRLTPSALEDTFALRITRVLAQLEDLLALSRLPSIDTLVADSFLNAVDNQKDIGLYAGYPTPLAIREMQVSREAITIFSYLLLAEIGLLTILAHRTPHEKFEQFRSVKSKYADQFAAALQPFDDFSSYERVEDLFEWVEGESDRATCQQVFGRIVAALKVIAILRSAGAKGD
jgi:hypothetical protein